MLVHTFYESDGRVMRYAEALSRTRAEVEAIVLGKGRQPPEEDVNGLKVLRVQGRTKNETARYVYLSRLARFFVRSMLGVTRRHLRKPFARRNSWAATWRWWTGFSVEVQSRDAASTSRYRCAPHAPEQESVTER